MDNNLPQKLKTLAESDIYPFHMPGHKRLAPGSHYSIDITEIDGFDDLHAAHDILKSEQDKAAAVYGSENCYFLVNGSTCGNLAAICACVKHHDSVLIAGNCHRSVFHAAEIMQLNIKYVYPVKTQCGILGQLLPEDIESILNSTPDIKAVIITSPTYDGVISDIYSIAHIVHKRNIPLIVDEAHGAHLGFHEAFPENAVRLNADAVIMSLHKTLPSLTQTSLLHILSERIDTKAVEHYLDIFETSSPSYVLMESISRCIDMLSKPSIHECFESYADKLKFFYEQSEGLSHLEIVKRQSFKANEIYDFDIGKIIIKTNNLISGDDLKNILLNKYGLQLELSSPDYALAMTSIMDTREGFERLIKALKSIDSTL